MKRKQLEALRKDSWLTKLDLWVQGKLPNEALDHFPITLADLIKARAKRHEQRDSNRRLARPAQR